MKFKKPKVIAEIGCNHKGDFNIAIDLLNKTNEYTHCEQGWSIQFSADHGSLIPHITVDGGMTGPNGAIWHEKCRNILQTTKIWINTDVDILKLFTKSLLAEDDISPINVTTFIAGANSPSELW